MKGDRPVLVGVGEAVSRWDGAAGPAGAPSPLSLASEAAFAALSDAGVSGLASRIDTIAFIRVFEDSVPGVRHPHGHNANLPWTLARRIGAEPARAIYTSLGGQVPQETINELSGRICKGEIDAALIVGAEATGASRTATRLGLKLDWADNDDRPFEDRGMGMRLIARAEAKHGLVTAPALYALMENAIAARLGRTRSAHRKAMASLFAPFSRIAAANPFAQFPVARTATFLAEATRENYELADPFLKWHVAQDAVNQGAAAILMCESLANEHNIPPHRRVYMHGAGEATDRLLSERPVLDRSWAMKAALQASLEGSELTADRIALFDLYSCFPCAVTCACEAMGIDPFNDPRPLTLTGGLPFFGGPGNNYSLHGVAAMVRALRKRPGDFGLVLANGGWMTKEAAGIYSTSPPASFRPAQSSSQPPPAIAVVAAPGEAVLETFTVLHGRTGPESGVALLRRPDGARTIAKAATEALQRLREVSLHVGARVWVQTEGEVSTFEFS